MNFNKKKLILMCVLGFAFQANAAPLTQQSAEQFYKYNDVDNMIQLKQVDPQKYTNYAMAKVQMQLQGRVVPEQTRQQAVKEIETVYKKFVETKMNQIQTDAIQYYKVEFIKAQTEESIKHQIEFYQTNPGRVILAKQKVRRSAIQNLQKNIPLEIASQQQLQAAFSQVLGSQ